MNKQEICTYDKERAFKLTELILDCGYVCMLSREEGLYIIDFIETLDWENYRLNEDNEANRNGVVFMGREDFEEKYAEVFDEEIREDKI